MSCDTESSTSYHCESFEYVPDVEETERILWEKLSLDMLGKVGDYSKLAEDFKKKAFPDTKPESRERIPSKYYLDEIKSSEGKVVFKGDYFLEVELSKEDGLFFFQNDRFNIFGSGIGKEEALKDFCEFFIHDYLSYKETPPEDLTKDACQLLNEYESVISTFEPA